MRLVCFPFASAANSGFRFWGRVDVVVFVEEELAGGGGLTVGVCCATAENDMDRVSKTSQQPKRATFDVLLASPSFDAEFRWRNEMLGKNAGAVHRNRYGWGIKLSRGKFNAPED